MRDGLLAWQTSEDMRIEVEFGEVEMKQRSFPREFTDLLVIICVNQ